MINQFFWSATLFSYPIFLLLATNSFLALIIAYLLFAFLLGLTVGRIMPIALETFDVRLRFSGSCIAFNLSMSIFGGSAPLLGLYLTSLTHSTNSPAFLLMLSALISLIILLLIPKYQTYRMDESCLAKPF